MHIITCTSKTLDAYIEKHSLDEEELKNTVEQRVGEIIDFMPSEEKQSFSFDYNNYLINIDFIKSEFCEVHITDIKKRIGGNNIFKIYENVNQRWDKEPAINEFDQLIKKRNNKYLNKHKHTIEDNFSDIVFPWYEMAENRWFIEGDEEIAQAIGMEELLNIVSNSYDDKDYDIIDDRVGFTTEENCKDCIIIFDNYINKK